MFEEHKQKKAEEARRAAEAKAKQDYLGALAVWEHQRDELKILLALAEGGNAYEGGVLVLKKGEQVLLQVTGVGIVEERRGAGQWKGGSQGISFPIGKVAGRSVRYRVGTTRGHYTQGEVKPAMVDKGTMSITNQRIVYQGSSKSVECAFGKLLGIQHSPGAITVSVSNRQKPTVLYFGSALDDTVSDRLQIAIALFHDEGEQIKQQIQEQIQEHEIANPKQP
jgi:hypothetical protein